MQVFFCILTGYLFGNILTADIVSYRIAGKPSSAVGRTGNPGMANIMENLGFLPGIAVLFGDILKTAAACFLSWHLFGKATGDISRFYAGLGCVLGHDFPAWKLFRGGKGVTCTCAAEIFFLPGPGVVSCLAGALTVILTKYLCVGAPVIPAVFTVWMAIQGKREEAILSLILTILMFSRHYPAIRDIRSGECPKTDVIKLLRKRKK